MSVRIGDIAVALLCMLVVGCPDAPRSPPLAVVKMPTAYRSACNEASPCPAGWECLTEKLTEETVCRETDAGTVCEPVEEVPGLAVSYCMTRCTTASQCVGLGPGQWDCINSKPAKGKVCVHLEEGKVLE